jgi:hypothetical protein
MDEVWGAASSVVLSARKLKFWLEAPFESTWCTSYSEFWKSYKNSGVKKIEISFKNFQKMLELKIWWTMPFGNLYSDFLSNFLQENLEFFLKKNCLSPSGQKLESWHFAWTCFARLCINLHTQIWNFLEFALEFSWKILEFSSKMVNNLSKSVLIEARELKFCKNMFC